MQLKRSFNASVGFLFLIAMLIASASGCARMAVSKATAGYETLLNPAIGTATKQDMLMKLGPPTKRDTIEGIEVWTYYRSYGTRGSAWVSPGQYLTTGGGHRWETYDSINLYFDSSGTLKKWDGYIQR